MEELVKWGGYLLTGIVGWFVKTLWNAQSKLREDMSELALNVSENYTKKTDFRDMIDSFDIKIKESTQPLYKKLDRIEDILLNRPHMPRKTDERD